MIVLTILLRANFKTWFTIVYILYIFSFMGALLLFDKPVSCLYFMKSCFKCFQFWFYWENFKQNLICISRAMEKKEQNKKGESCPKSMINFYLRTLWSNNRKLYCVIVLLVLLLSSIYWSLFLLTRKTPKRSLHRNPIKCREGLLSIT